MKVDIVCTFLISIIIGINANRIPSNPNIGDVEVHLLCQADPATHANYEEIRKADRGRRFNRDMLGTHALCLTTKSGVQSQDGELNRNELRNQLRKYITNSDKIDDTMNCIKQHKSPQETALNIFRCFFRATGAQARYSQLYPQ